MNNDEFLTLMEAVEDQGGVHLPGRCLPTQYRAPMVANSGVKRKVKLHTSGCGNETMFLAAYTHEDGETHTLECCAVCDNMLDWPRFRPSSDQKVMA